MIVPAPIPISQIPVGGVYTVDNTAFYMKCDATTQVDLATGAIATGIDPNQARIYLPGARLVLA